MPELQTAQENARLEIGSQRDRNSNQIDVLGIYDLQGLSYGRTELLVADMRLQLKKVLEILRAHSNSRTTHHTQIRIDTNEHTYLLAAMLLRRLVRRLF